ncbi:MAG: hypothetical protein LBN18_02275 [Dysgonamonadaceae bacterium]|jgi:hypothetical protein|nr:hypothetical protein [Dysgonamonadaceae bacterium]
MKKDNDLQDKFLTDLFEQMLPEIPSAGFQDSLMSKIQKAALREKRKIRWKNFGQMAAAVAGIVLIPCLALYVYALWAPDVTFSFSRIYWNFNPIIAVAGFAVLVLLIGDLLFRKYSRF